MQDANLLRPSRAAHYTGWEHSLAVLTDALQQHAPIDGILGGYPSLESRSHSNLQVAQSLKLVVCRDPLGVWMQGAGV